jgi:uncharacterized protein (TIGR03435 family)
MDRAPHHPSLLQLSFDISLRACLIVALRFGTCAAVAQTHMSGPSPVLVAPSAMPSGSTSFETGPDSWTARGFDLKTLIAQVYDVDPRRIDLPDTPPARYDLTLKLPQEVDADTMQRLLAEAIEKQFAIAIAPATRSIDVYVLTAPHGPGPALRRHAAAPPAGLMHRTAIEDANTAPADASRITYIGKECSGVSAGGISAIATTMADLRRTLEPTLDRLLVDDTHLTGSFDFAVGSYRNQQELFDLLHRQLGLAVALVRRNITVLAVKPVSGKP